MKENNFVPDSKNNCITIYDSESSTVVLDSSSADEDVLVKNNCITIYDSESSTVILDSSSADEDVLVINISDSEMTDILEDVSEEYNNENDPSFSCKMIISSESSSDSSESSSDSSELSSDLSESLSDSSESLSSS
ncbi:suppressor protein SRP40-like [Leptopilina heterotoma]|uniref:suppressor protein SRP40-like n=1 Tax=Leptopilina heterotoma TaxID=63436 RepID=UPI001CA89193|nr:suppressor protein SRP40-like [Leptopilina heterotoma]